MAVSRDRVIERAGDASRPRTKSSVLRLIRANTRNNEGSLYEAAPEFAPLLPPFMQTSKRQKCSSVERSFSQVSRETVDHDVTRHAYSKHPKEIASLGRDDAAREDTSTDEGKSSTSSRSGEVASKSDVSCKDTKVTREAICEALPGLDRYEAECLAEMGEQHNYLESRELDHHEWSEDFRKDETDYREWRNVEKGEARWTLAHREGPLSSESDHEDQDSNDTDPLLAHELLVPYNRMPRPRLCRAAGKNAEYTSTALPRRPRSPIRQILPGRFDLRARTEELLKRQRIARARRYLQKSKDRITQSVKQLSDTDVDFDLKICTLVLRALCEQVILTMAGANTGIDVHTFINTAIIWALVDLEVLDPSILDKHEGAVFVELGLFDINALPRNREAVGTSKLRRALFQAHRPKFDPYIATQLHRRLPWALISPAHQRGVVRNYPNVRERIDERLPDRADRAKSAYVPDLTCFHFREVSDKAYVAYKRKSKSLPVPESIDRERDDELLMQIISFV